MSNSRTRLGTIGLVVAMIATVLGPFSPQPAQATSGGSPYQVPAVVDTNPDPGVVETTIVSDEATVDIGGGVMAEAQTFNGSIPGPEFQLTVGQRVIVHFENHLDNEATGIHWHGIELSNSMDGVPLTQNQVPPGGSFTYDFVVHRPGVFWYHPHHQYSTNQVFKGMYGSIIVTDPNQTALISSGALPSTSDTHTLVLSDVTVCKAQGSNDTATYDPTLPWVGGGPLNPQPAPTPEDLCEGNPIDHDGIPFPAGYSAGEIPSIQTNNQSRVNEGQTVLTNGVNAGGRAGSPSAPGALDPGASVMAVNPGQGIRLQLVNAATTRFFRLGLTLADGTQVPLVRVGGEAGLLNAAVVEGTQPAGFDFKYDSGQILIDPGDREDIVIAFPTTASGVATLWTMDFERTGGGSGTPKFADLPTVPIAHFDVTGPTESPIYTISAGTPLRNATGDPVEMLPAATGSLLDPALLGKPGMVSSDIQFTASGGAGINGISAHHSFSGNYAHHPPPDSARYASIGDVLELSVTNTTSAHHPYHLHGFSIQPLTMTGCPGAVTSFNFAPEFMDNVDVPPGCTMTLRVRLEDRFFPDQTTMGGGLGRWMFHCHIFFHHHLGMVSELVVTDENGNERPYVDVLGTSVSVDEGDNASIGGTVFDPDGDAVTFTATVGTVTDHGDGTWTWNYVAEDGPSLQNVYITGTDSEGNKSQAQFRLEVANVAPTLTLDPAQITVIDEGDTLNVSATFSDPGVDEPYTATVDFGTGNGPQAATVMVTSTVQPQTGTIAASLQYGDDGVFPVTVTITDKDGASDTDGFVVTVDNVDPTALIENPNPLIAQVGDLVILDGRVVDPGSDDIDSTWSIDDGSTPENQVSLVNPPFVDPDPSPDVNPRDVEHDISKIFNMACAYEATFSALDDDGGSDSTSLIVVILNQPSKSHNAGYWQHQYTGNGKIDFSDAQLECYLKIVTALSSVFDEERPSTTIEDGEDALRINGTSDTREKLDRRLMVAWLNIANGGIGYDELVDSDGDHVVDTPFNVVLANAELVRLNPASTESVLHDQLNLLQRIHG